LTLPRLHPAQAMIKHEARRFNVLCCGRRFGKNVVGHDLMIKTALYGQPVAWCAPTYPELSEDWRELYGKLYPVISRSSSTEKRIELITGGSIDMWSLDGRQSMRGRKYARVIVNEAAKIPHLETEWNEVIRATLADLSGDAFFLSTPKGLNFFYNLYQRTEGSADWQRWHYKTHDNPYIVPHEIEAMRADMPERVYQQEILAEFIEDGSYFQNIEQCAVIEAPERPEQHAGHAIVMGVDWGKSNDWTVLTVGCKTCNRIVDWQRFNQIDYHYQRARLYEMYRKWGVRFVVPERNSIGEPNIEEMIRSGVVVLPGHDGKPGFATLPTTKPDLIETLYLALVRDGLLIPRDYADELRAYEITLTAARPKFSAPEGLHDDRVMSLALCWYAMAQPANMIVFGG